MEKGDKRTAIIEAALELVAEQGFHGTPMAMIASRAGVAAGTIYRYFANKDVLIRDIYTSLEADAWAMIREEYPEDQPIRDRYLHIGRKLIGYFLTSPLEFRFVEQFHNSPYGVDCRRDKFFGKKNKDLVTELFEEGQQQQIIKELPLPILSALTFGPLVDACRDHILQFINLDETLIEQITEACWDAIKR
jgi:AcrR family transcriptional regulator